MNKIKLMVHRRDVILKNIFKTILDAYINAYPEKSDELRKFEKRLDYYVSLAKSIGGRSVRVFLEELRALEGVESKDIFVDVSSVVKELREAIKDFELKKRELVAKFISEKLKSTNSEFVEVTKIGVESHRRVAKMLSEPIESFDCPACARNKRKARLLTDGKWHFCPLCWALYIEKDGQLNFVHRLSELDLELAIREFV